MKIHIPVITSDGFGAIEIEEPHTCPTCDGYGYLVKFPGWDTPITVGTSMEPLDRKCLRNSGTHSYDIPCPDCNEVE